MAMSNPEGGGVWSENGTVFTIGLRSPLIPGAPFRVELDDYSDLHGNTNTDGFTWEVAVEGTAQYLPMLDDWLFYYSGTWEEGPIFEENDLESAHWIEAVSSTDFRIWNYTEYYMPPAKVPDIPFEDYDLYRLTSGAVQLLGFHEVDDGEDIDVTFSPAVTWLPLPVDTGTWSGTSTFTEGEMTVQVDYAGEVLSGTVDIPLVESGGGMEAHWLGCRRVILDYELGDGEETFSTGRDSVWYAPGVGMVRQVSNGTEEGVSYREVFELEWAMPAGEGR
jgi:hypothetical protein